MVSRHNTGSIRSLSVALVGVAMAMDSVAEIQMVEPPWDMVTKHQGYTCIDASLDHDPFTENNTRCATLLLCPLSMMSATLALILATLAPNLLFCPFA